MPTVFSFVMISLDGYYQDEARELGWNLVDDEFMDWNIRQTTEVGTLLLGRETYDHFEDLLDLTVTRSDAGGRGFHEQGPQSRGIPVDA